MKSFWHGPLLHDHKIVQLQSRNGINPKSEIKTANLPQDFGEEMNRKNRSHTQSGLVRFFQFIHAQQIAADWPFLFRISGLIEYWLGLPQAGGANPLNEGNRPKLGLPKADHSK
jgi:hypothetical protein